MRALRAWIPVFAWFGIVLLARSASADIFMFTEMGDVFRSDDGGVSFDLVSNAGFNDGVAIAFVNDTLGYLLTESGTILKTANSGVSWTPVAALPATDAQDIIFDGTNFFVLSRSGDVYRGSEPSALTLVGAIPANDLVSLAHNGSALYALSSSGDVSRSNDDGGSWLLVGSTGSTEMVAIAIMGDSLFALNSLGDIFTSSNSGSTWQLTSTVSQVGAVDLDATTNNILLVCFDTGELMQRSGKGWQYTGTASQVGVRGLGLSGGTTAIEDSDDVGVGERFVVQTVIYNGMLKLNSPAGEVRMYSTDGRVVRDIIKGEGEATIDISELSQGIYFVRQGLGTAKIAKVK